MREFKKIVAFLNFSCSLNEKDSAVGVVAVLKYAHKPAQASVALLGNQITLVLTVTSSEHRIRAEPEHIQTIAFSNFCFPQNRKC